MVNHILRKYWKQNLYALLLTATESGGIIISTVFLAEIMNSLIEQNSESFFSSFVFSFLAWAGALFFGYLRLRYVEKIKQEQIVELKDTIIEKVSKSTYSQFHERNANEYISWLTNDINLIEEQGFGHLYSGMSSATLLLFSSIAIFNFHWILLIVSLFLSLLMVLIPRFFKKKLDDRNSTLSSAFEKYVSRVDEWIKGFDSLYSYNRTKMIIEKLSKETLNVKQEKILLRKERTNLYTFIRLTSIIAQYSIILVTGLMTLGGVLSAGAILAIGDLTGNFFGNTSFFIDQVTNFLSALTVSRKMDEFVSEDLDQIESVSDYDFVKAINVKDVSFSYGAKEIKIPDMVFEKGKKYAIIGRSGSGKSTFLNILMKNYPNYHGQIKIDSVELKNIDFTMFRERFSYVPQKNYLFDMSLTENITLEKSYSKERVLQVIEDMSLNEKSITEKETLGVRGSNLSGGQAQRVSLARGFIHAQDVLIIDEGTSSLDPKTAYLIEENILTNRELTVIFVTHHLNDSLKKYFEDVYSFDTNE